MFVDLFFRKISTNMGLIEGRHHNSVGLSPCRSRYMWVCCMWGPHQPHPMSVPKVATGKQGCWERACDVIACLRACVRARACIPAYKIIAPVLELVRTRMEGHRNLTLLGIGLVSFFVLFFFQSSVFRSGEGMWEAIKGIIVFSLVFSSAQKKDWKDHDGV